MKVLIHNGSKYRKLKARVRAEGLYMLISNSTFSAS